jgi:DNA-nicking Smr family endonuclease
MLICSTQKHIIKTKTVNKLELKKLKKQLIENQKSEKLAEQKAHIQQVNDNRDDDLFREAMSGVSPLPNDKAYHEDEVVASKPMIRKAHPFEEDELEIHDPLSDELHVEEVEPEGTISFCETGIQKGVFRKLRSGQYRISDELDLHGASIKQAKKILMYYLQETPQFESCCVRIIHGKGNRSGNSKPVLKTQVNHWLIEHERVLAFHSAKDKDGGTGAVYVLLKR